MFIDNLQDKFNECLKILNEERKKNKKVINNINKHVN